MAGFTPVTAIAQSMQQGARIAVMVEGEEENSDAWVLSQLLRDVVGAVKFWGRGSWQSVEQDAEALRQLFPCEEQRVFTIRDRDFLPDEEVLSCYAANYTGTRFVWQRYTLENYLLEPQAVFGALDALLHDRIPPALTSPELAAQEIERLARALAPQAAGNWLIRELNELQVLSAGLKYSENPEGLSADDALRRIVDAPAVQLAAQTHPAFEGQAIVANFQAKLAAVNASFPDNFHRFISGKHLRDALWLQIPPPRLPKASFRNLLLRFAIPVPGDIVTIVKRQILKVES